jgi:hypothetical protein
MQIIEPTYVDDDTLISCDAPEVTDAITEWDIAVSYITGQRVCLTDPGTHKIYECLWHTPDCLAKYPPDYLDTTPAYWMELGATNPWKLFDEIVAPERCEVSDNVPGVSWAAGILWLAGTSWATFSMTSLEVSVQLDDVETVALMNIDCDSVTVTIKDSGQVIFDQADVPTTTIFNNMLFDLPTYAAGSIIQVIARDTSATTVAIGEIVYGTRKVLGRTKYGVGVGLVDYSIKQTDSFGDFTILERSFSKRLNCVFTMEPSVHSGIMRILENYRATPLVWIVSDLYSTTMAYGFYRDFSMTIPGLNIAECEINIESLGAEAVYATEEEDDWVPPWDGTVNLTDLVLDIYDDPVAIANLATVATASSEALITPVWLPIYTKMPIVHAFNLVGNCLISVAEPAVVTYAAHGLPDGHKVLFHTTVTLPLPLIEDRYYYVRNPGLNTFNIALTREGSTIDTTLIGAGTHSLYASTDYFADSTSATHGMTSDNIEFTAFGVHADDGMHAMTSSNIVLT